MCKKSIAFVFTLVYLMLTHSIHGESYFKDDWIKYGQQYVKLKVSQEGIQRVKLSDLPNEISAGKLDRIQLWHRGEQVAILQVTSQEILFYGVPNDGASDSLLYRPTSSRLNPYWSMYSDVSAYFLTVGENVGRRAEILPSSADLNNVTDLYHIVSDLKVYNSDYSLSTNIYIKPSFINSFFEIGASRTGSLIEGSKLVIYNINLKGLVEDVGVKPSVKLLLHGRSSGRREFELYAGSSESKLRLIKKVTNLGFEGTEISFELDQSDLDSGLNSMIAIKSVSTSTLDYFSLAYMNLSYPQVLDMQGKANYLFQFPPSKFLESKAQILNVPDGAYFIDITNRSVPKLILGDPKNSLSIRKYSDKKLKLYISKELKEVVKANITSVEFGSPFRTDPNFIIICSEELIAGAQKYADYRSTALGGKYQTMVVSIKDIYDRFNFGEPSPVAIRNFADYIISKGGNQKYLMLIGKSITFNERMVRELPGEVPTIGFPGSDYLLVEGLGGADYDVPAIPIGRLPAVTNDHVTDYLSKVQDYEQNTYGDLGWRKKILHLNGGKSAAEITQLKNLLIGITPKAEGGFFGGEVIPFAKQQAMLEVESVNITPNVNNGVGMITYFGHGSTTVTDLDLGYATDPNRGYSNVQRYPFMYFNGCGVGNVFSARFNPSPTAGDRYTLTMDWLLAKDRGAIAIIANSFESYVAPSATYLEVLYDYMFVKEDYANASIGNIQIAVAKEIVGKGRQAYDMANLHQSILQGDPSLMLVSVPNSDFSIDIDNSIILQSNQANNTIDTSPNIIVKTYIKNLGRYVKNDKLDVNIIVKRDKGESIYTKTINSFSNRDTLSILIEKGDAIREIRAILDPKNLIKEMSEENNVAILNVDWDLAKEMTFYPQTAVADKVPPILSLSANNNALKRGDKIATNTTFQLTLVDDRPLPNDINLVEVFIKSCWDISCSFSSLKFTEGIDIKLSEDLKKLQINFADVQLKEDGQYEILITGKDAAGNVSLYPYSMQFEVSSEASKNIEFVASPNPAENYLRLQIKSGDISDLSSVDLIIYNSLGVKVDELTFTADQQNLHEIYWNTGSNSTGLYIYEILYFSSAKTELYSTKRKFLIRR